MYNLMALLLPEGKKDLQEVLNLDQSQESNADDTPVNMSLVQLSTMDDEEEEMEPGEIAKQRELQKRRDLYLEAKLLLQHYNKETMAALVRCTRHTLDTIKRRVTSPSAIKYGDTAEDQKRLDHRPALKVKLILAIPHVALKPGLDEIQAMLNATIQNVLAVHKAVVQWGQKGTEAGATGVQGISPGMLQAQSVILRAPSGVLGAPSRILNAHSGVFNAKSGLLGAPSRILNAHSGVFNAKSGLLGAPSRILNAHSGVFNAKSGVLDAPSGILNANSGVLNAKSGVLGARSGILSLPSSIMTSFRKRELKTFYKSVAEHKEIAKLVSMMASTISSAKMLVAQSLEPLKQYDYLWVLDRTEHMNGFLAKMPSLLDFEAKIKEYAMLDDTIAEEEDVRRCGSLALMTG